MDADLFPGLSRIYRPARASREMDTCEEERNRHENNRMSAKFVDGDC